MLVSVVIPVFNRVGTVGDAIRSVLQQVDCGGAVEIVAVDDGSTDGSWGLLQSFGPAVRAFKQENAGPAAARNRAFREARGSFIALLDSDDWWADDKLAKQMALFGDDPSLIAVCSDAIYVRDGAPLRQTFANMNRVPTSPEGLRGLMFSASNPVITSSMVFRREVLNRLGGMNTALRVSEDYEMWLRMAELGDIRRHPEPLTYYRHHDGNTMAGVTADRNFAIVEDVFHNLYADRPEMLRQSLSALRRRYAISAIICGDPTAARRYALAALRFNPFHLATLVVGVAALIPMPVVALARRCVRLVRKA